MKRLTEKQIEAYLAKLQEALHPGKCDHKEHIEYYHNTGLASARLEMPLGELTNEKIAGHILGLKMKYGNLRNWLQTKWIEKSDKFNAQKLEGKVVISNIPLLTAISIYRELPRFRCNIYLNL